MAMRILMAILMATEELTKLDLRLMEYIKKGDFETNKWSTPEAARKLGVKNADIYKSLHNIAKNARDRIYIHYKDGGIRISAE
jgi:DNA-binding MurR/RpiR family transcriptional regulator